MRNLSLLRVRVRLYRVCPDVMCEAAEVSCYVLYYDLFTTDNAALKRRLVLNA